MPKKQFGKRQSITRLVEDYITNHPSVKDCLKNDLVNFSNLSRQTAEELGLDVKRNFDAILIACRRFQLKLKKEETFEKRIIKILGQSKVEIKNKIAVIVLDTEINSRQLLSLENEALKKKVIFRTIEGTSAVSIITTEDFASLVKEYFKDNIITENKRLAEIIIKSPEEIEETPGTYAYLCSLFGDHNINIVEALSCWTDTIFLIKEEDVGKVMGLMRF